MLRRLSRRTPLVTPEQAGYSGPTFTPGEANVRVPVGTQPQAAPDPPAQGMIPSRPALVQVATFFYDTQATEDERFRTGRPEFHHAAAMPRGRQTVDQYRQNIGRAQATAYGSMVSMNV